MLLLIASFSLYKYKYCFTTLAKRVVSEEQIPFPRSLLDRFIGPRGAGNRFRDSAGFHGPVWWRYVGVNPNMGVGPPNHPFVHRLWNPHKPSILGVKSPYFWNHPCIKGLFPLPGTLKTKSKSTWKWMVGILYSFLFGSLPSFRG